MKNTLEGSRFFSIIAWALIISFSLFTYALAKNLQKEASDLAERTGNTTDALQNISTIR